MLKFACAAIIAAFVGTSTLGAADDPPDGGERHWPRPEAIAACKDKHEGDACTFEGHHGTVSCACRTVPGGGLACVHPHHHHSGTED